MKYGIHWFRRDLRVAGNSALQKQFKDHDGRVIGLFCFDKKFLSRPDFSSNRFQFFLHTLAQLRKELRAIGSDLLVLDIGPQEAITDLLTTLQENQIDLPASFSWSRDYEPFALARDKKMESLLKKWDVDYFTVRDHLIIEPHELSKPDGSAYKVYSPFARKWLELFHGDDFQVRVHSQKNAFTYLNKLKKGEVDKVFNLTWKKLLGKKVERKDHLDDYIEKNQKHVDIEIPPVGTLEALKYLESFKKKIDVYGEERNTPSVEGTSKMSLFLKNGSISSAQIIYFLKLQNGDESGAGKYLKEIIWREFYYHILTRFPEVEKEEFVVKFRKLRWENDQKLFKAWKEGKTGYPIVDAGMRQLNTTGWMHNRVRMIVSSFLTKHLLIDWRWGEKYFMEKLLDGDLAPNNGGWQWAASTGCDPQPYFRIFNPWLQSKRFDKDGVYIKSFVHELANTPAKELHSPIIGHLSYPAPIVDHKTRRVQALTLYKSVK